MIRIIAIGNSLYGDDGVGAVILDELKKIDSFESIDLVNGHVDALGLIDKFAGVNHVILIDAAKMGELPGTVKVFDGKKATLKIKSDHLSVHGLSIADTLVLAKKIEQYPEKLTIVAIEPERISIPEGLSQSVLNSIPNAVSKICSLVMERNPSIERGNYA